MANDDVVKCPMCGGFTHIEKSELLQALTDRGIREQVENYIASLLKSPVEEPAAVGVGKPEVRDFQKEVRRWNPCLPMWRRSPKE